MDQELIEEDVGRGGDTVRVFGKKDSRSRTGKEVNECWKMSLC